MNLRAAVFLALLAILVVASALRFTSLGWGLRHEPDWDERVFVQSAAWMAASGDLDHRFYEYPGLFVYLLAPVVARHGPPEVGPSAYLAARRLVAAFGVASVLLVFLLGRRLGGDAVGLTGALLLAVSPLDVSTSHMVRPDVVLATFFLAALLVFDTVVPSRGGDAGAGVAIGAAAAVKFTGVLLVPSYLVRRWTTPGQRWRGTLTAGALSAAAFALLSPYSVLNWRGFLEGVGTQWSYHYGSRGGVRTFGEKVLQDLRRLEDSFGWAAAVLILVGLVLVLRRDGRRWAPALLLPVVVLAMMATADVQWPRFLVPITGVLALAAGRVAAAVASRFGPLAATGLAVAAAVLPAIQSITYVRTLAAPGARDRALDWVHAQVPEGARILTTVAGLGVDPRRFEVLTAERLDEGSRRWAGHMDFVISGPLDDPAVVSQFETVHAEETAGIPLDVPVRVLVPKPALRPSYSAVALEVAWVTASESSAAVPAMLDGDVKTFWRTGGPQVPEASWIEIRLPRRVVVGRIVLGLGRHWRREPKILHVLARDGDGEWRRIRAMPGRAPVERQVLPVAERSLEYVLDPTAATVLRLVQVGRAGKHWNVAELRVDAVP